MSLTHVLAGLAIAGTALSQTITTPPVVTITAGTPNQCTPTYDCCLMTANSQYCGFILEMCAASASTITSYPTATVSTCSSQEPCLSSLIVCNVNAQTSGGNLGLCGSQYNSCTAATALPSQVVSSVLATTTSSAASSSVTSTDSSAAAPVMATSSQLSSTASSATSSSSIAPVMYTSTESATGSGVVYTTKVVTAYTTYCPSATVITVHSSMTITVSSATTLTITDCPCTISSVVSQKSQGSSKVGTASSKSMYNGASGSAMPAPSASSKASSSMSKSVSSPSMSAAPYAGAAVDVWERMNPVAAFAAAVAAALII